MNLLGKKVKFKCGNRTVKGKVVNTLGKNYEIEKDDDIFVVKIKDSMDAEDNPADVYMLVRRKNIL